MSTAPREPGLPPGAPPGAIDTARELLGELALPNVSVGSLTTYRVGGPAALLVEAGTEADLLTVRDAVVASGVPVLVLGRGSNVLVADAGFDGLVVTLGPAFTTLEADGVRVRAGAALALPQLARRTAALGLTGLEWAVGVPGTVGGAVRMNAGGHGSDTAETLTGCSVVDLAGGPVGHLGAEVLHFSYRHSTLAPTTVVTAGDFLLRPGDRAESEAQIAEIVRWRRQHQPGGQNAGSVFTNPPGDSAGRLIEGAGMKGFRLGSAAVSDKHANFIQADDGGSADDVWTLVQLVQQRVEGVFGQRLVPELKTVGFEQRAPVRP